MLMLLYTCRNIVELVGCDVGKYIFKDFHRFSGTLQQDWILKFFSVWYIRISNHFQTPSPFFKRYFKKVLIHKSWKKAKNVSWFSITYCIVYTCRQNTGVINERTKGCVIDSNIEYLLEQRVWSCWNFEARTSLSSWSCFQVFLLFFDRE